MIAIHAGNDDVVSAGPSWSTKALKRLIDITAAAIGLVLLAAPFLVVALAIRLDSLGPTFFRQQRVGRGGKLFKIFKFRTMAFAVGSREPALTLRDDRRVTSVGLFLRRTKIDELPQLLNVLAGSMSLVGPRPEVPEFMTFYTPEQRSIILSTRPGITDYASILFRDEEKLLDQRAEPLDIYRYQIIPIKFRYYERYCRNVGVVNDLRIILATFLVLALGKCPKWMRIADLEEQPLLKSSLAAEPR
jgi:lipopolysaccharide/colanic/teichoic acid biosynthesis glycosyltransferase